MSFTPPYNHICEECKKQFGSYYPFDFICFTCSNPELSKSINNHFNMKEENFTLVVKNIRIDVVECHLLETNEIRSFEKILFEDTPLLPDSKYNLTIITGIGSIQTKVTYIEPEKYQQSLEEEKILNKWNKIYSRFKEDVEELYDEFGENKIKINLGYNLFLFSLKFKNPNEKLDDDLPF